MSINGLDDKQILTFMQLTSGKTYTFVGTTGDYSNFMCVTAGMFSEPEAPVTKWCIIATFNTQSGYAYISIEDSDSYDSNPFTYLIPYSLSPMNLTYINMYSEEFIMEGSYNAFQMTMGDSENLFGTAGEVMLGVSTDDPFQLDLTIPQMYDVKVGGSEVSMNTFSLSEIVDSFTFNDSQTKQSSGNSFVFTTQLKQAKQTSWDVFEEPTLAFGNSETAIFDNTGKLTFVWEIAFNNFEADATLHTGYIESGYITTREESRWRSGDTMYRQVYVSLPCMSFVKI